MATQAGIDALHRALVSSYRLSIITMPLTEAVWLQFAMHIFGVIISVRVCTGEFSEVSLCVVLSRVLVVVILHSHNQTIVH